MKRVIFAVIALFMGFSLLTPAAAEALILRQQTNETPVATPNPPPQPTPKPLLCRDVQPLVDGGALSIAEQIYEEFLKKDALDACAINGLKQIQGKRCQFAREQVQRGNLAAAKEIYTRLVTDDPTLDCAVNGLAEIFGAERCRLADYLLETGDTAGARDAYTALLEKNPDLPCAMQGLIKLADPAEKVRRYLREGDYAEAWKWLKAGREANPSNRELWILSLQGWTLTPRVQDFWKLYNLDAVLRVVGWSALLLGLVVLVAVVGHNRNKLRWDIGGFEKGAVKLKVGTDEVDLNQDLIAGFEQELAALKDLPLVKNPDIISGPLELPDLPIELPPIPSGVGKVIGFLNKLYPAKLLTISGTLKFDSDKGAGIAARLVMNRGNQVWGVFTVWQSEVDPNFQPGVQTLEVKDYENLCRPAVLKAYWLAYEKVYKDPHKDLKESLRCIFGTAEVDSYIAVQIGAALWLKRKFDLAERWFWKALALDKAYAAAWFNLGLTKAAQADIQLDKDKNLNPREVYQPALDCFTQAKDLCKNDQSKLVLMNAAYNLGITYLYLYSKTQQAHYLDNAYIELETAYEQARSAKDQESSRVSQDLGLMFEIPYLFTRVLKGKLNDPNDDINRIRREGFVSARVRYNLACLASDLVKFNQVPGSKMFDFLRTGIEDLKQALLIEPGYADFMRTDPSLERLRKEKSYQELEQQYPAKTEAPPTKPPCLADLVGQAAADSLDEASEIQTPEELLSRARTKEGRKRLSILTSINALLLRDWARQVELMRISGLQLGHVLVLSMAKVYSIKDLAKYRGQEALLLTILEKKKDEMKLAVELPDLERIELWIDQAERTDSVVEAG